MSLRTGLSTLLLSVLMIGAAASGQVFAQTAKSSSEANDQSERDETNLDTQLYLVLGTNQNIDDARLPVALDSAVKQLRASLPFKNYRLAATLISRVKDKGRVILKWIGGPLVPLGAVSATTPSFNEFRINGVKLVQDAAGQSLVRMEGFSFGVQIPIVTNSTVASNGPIAPIINYENTGLNTDISMREGEPAIVGTLNIGPSGDAIILVMSAKRTNK